jgi:hypothetical protein
VALDLLVDGLPVTSIVHRSRSSGAPDAPSHEVEAAAIQFTATYVEAHPLLFHRLFREDAPPRGKVCSIWVERRHAEIWLAFKVIVEEVSCEMFISAELHPRSFRPTTPTPISDEELLLILWASTYDICLAYMVENPEEIRSLGFDTSKLLREGDEVAGGM